jgi:hypothetical protein
MKRQTFLEGKAPDKVVVHDGVILDTEKLLADNVHFKATQARALAEIHAEKAFKKQVDDILDHVQYNAKEHGWHSRSFGISSDAQFIRKNEAYFESLGYRVKISKIWKFVQDVSLEW